MIEYVVNGEEPRIDDTAVLSEPALAEWNTEDEDRAWASLQRDP